MGGDGRRSGAGDGADALLASLCALAAQVGIKVRVEPFDLKMVGKGGLCRVRGQRIILVDAALSLVDQIGIIGEALGRALPKRVVVSEALRPYLSTGHGAVRCLLRPRPLARGRVRQR